MVIEDQLSDTFTIRVEDDAALIELFDFKVRVERNRKLTSFDTGLIAEAVLYKESCSFIPEATYVFEVTYSTSAAFEQDSDKMKLDNVIAFFFSSILNTDNYLKSYPECSTLHYTRRVDLKTLSEEDHEAKLTFKSIC